MNLSLHLPLKCTTMCGEKFSLSSVASFLPDDISAEIEVSEEYGGMKILAEEGLRTSIVCESQNGFIATCKV